MTKNDLAPLGWIRVAERMPPESGDDFLVYSRNHRVSMESGWHIHRLAQSAIVDKDECFYTHWMPLPAAPSAEPGDEHGICPVCEAGTGHGGKRIHLEGCPSLNRTGDV